MKNFSKILIIFIATLLVSTILYSQSEEKLKGLWEGEEKIAIVVGVNEYDHLDPLRFTDDDSREMIQVLEKYGRFSSIEYYGDEKDDIDQIAGTPTKVNIENAVSLAADDIREGYFTTLLLYFSARGYQHDGKVYMATKGTKTDDLENTAINLSEILESLKDLKDMENVKIMFFLDIGRSNPDGGDEPDPKNPNKLSSWDDVINSNGVSILYSTTNTAYSYETGSLQNGVYTYYLVEGLSGAADEDSNGFISLDEISNYVDEMVNQWSTEAYKQDPMLDDEKKNGKFYITCYLEEGCFE
jgi:uncharacterized caspase-like protein